MLLLQAHNCDQDILDKCAIWTITSTNFSLVPTVSPVQVVGGRVNLFHPGVACQAQVERQVEKDELHKTP